MLNNKANRECCDVDIRSIVAGNYEPFLYFTTANVVGLEITSEDTYAKAKGKNRIAFSNPMDGTFSIEAQIVPIQLYALLSDGTIDNKAVVAEKKTVTCETAGQLTIPEGIKAGTLFVYESGDFAGTAIEGSFTAATFTAASAENIKSGEEYDIGYIVEKTKGVKKVSLNNSKNPKAYYVTLNTFDKNEDDVISEKKITVYKAKPQKSISLSYSSDGDPASITITFTALEDKNGNVIDMVDVEDEE